LGLDSLAALSALRAAGDRMGAELSARWESLRARPEMQYAALALPRVLAREPHMGPPSRRRGAAFFETQGSSPLPIEHGCWLSAAWAFAANVISAQARDGWCSRICGPNVGRLTDLPCAYLPGDLDGPELRPVDVNIKYHLEADLGRLGLAPLMHFRNADHAAFHHASAVHARRADGPPQNAGQARRTVAFAGVMAASRLMHGIRIMVCQGLREGKTISDVATAANEWLRPYTSNREPEVESFNSGVLLREGRVEIQSVAGEPGMVEIQADLAPWVPGEPLPQMVRMTARVRS
jgi:type VI secretion system protein ImpC